MASAYAVQKSHSNVMKEKKASCKTNDRQSKGLRHFAVRVCAKVEEKHVTTYNEVADELVQEVLSGNAEKGKEKGEKQTPREFDEKNIRRRVYDALNVLMAMDIIEKSKKEIRWRGLPFSTNKDEAALKEAEQRTAVKETELEEKRARITELRAQKLALERLTKRNAASHADNSSRVYLPFIVVRTNSTTEIDLEVEEGREAVCFTFNDNFAVEDEQTIMRRLGFFDDDLCPPDDLSQLNNVLQSALYSPSKPSAYPQRYNLSPELATPVENEDVLDPE
mmetsp:Transcript_2999/g.9184  ORF Transcript_2999/g.9184 Transcript_2999/m.9184 type:complete len:279 (+) Transcript_2999:222-1058(+)|eukprot:CAMPEP_0198724402 /NCGR_PEP_ID=MMETSP1475-20131203/1886_1 /TAXON_ID= ORGANISM="Unidentified sp., Strain CCMP1999" /NCGR_SAMPLE_ID=MMETSP1475 /ASSEMBLY_ACC=CAM_ASM_001111 /LENGTH=278 /DNA_ID=CAMNT_0044485931 /DNA_START=190 /DNA_END=1026 /DNA_ORIENTATION=+